MGLMKLQPDLAAVPLRFSLGEKTVWVWRPLLAVIDFGDADRGPWTEPDPEDLPAEADGLMCRRAPQGRYPLGISRHGRYICYAPRVEKLYFVSITGTFEEYLGRFSAKRRHNLKRSVRWFSEHSNGCAMTVALSAEEIEVFHRRAVEISHHTYQDKLLGAGMPADPEFLASMKKIAQKGMARGYLLWCENRPVAFAWCSGKGDRLNYGIIGYLPDYAKMSPGTALLYLILEDLFREKKFRMFDFGVGEGWYKESFATGCEEFVNAFLFLPSWRNRILLRLHAATEAVNSGAGALLERFGLKKAVKRLIRALGGA